jgi:hypothetical protein
MVDLNKRKGLAKLVIVPFLGTVLASATIVPPERVASVLHQKVGASVTEDCKDTPKPATKSPVANRTAQETKKNSESGHPSPDPIKHLLRGILL